jgi:hypothetical protein
VDLKHVLGDIQPDRGNLHPDGAPHVIRLRRSLYGTSMPGAGAVHHIISSLSPGKKPSLHANLRKERNTSWAAPLNYPRLEGEGFKWG